MKNLFNTPIQLGQVLYPFLAAPAVESIEKLITPQQSNQALLGITAVLLASCFAYKYYYGTTDHKEEVRILRIENEKLTKLNEEIEILNDQITKMIQEVRASLANTRDLPLPPGLDFDLNDVNFDIDKTDKRFYCPITLKLMSDPIILPGDSNYYERRALQMWFDRGNRSAPIRKDIKLTDPYNLPSNPELQQEIINFAKSNQHQSPSPSPS